MKDGGQGLGSEDAVSPRPGGLPGVCVSISGDGQLTIDEIVAAANNSLTKCAGGNT